MKEDSSALFREEVQGVYWIITLLIIGLVLIAVFGAVQTREAEIPAFVGVIIALIPILFGRMVTDIDSHNINIRFGYLRWMEKKIPISDIEQVEVVTYRPLRQFGGWGIRCGRFHGERTVCYSMRGSKGVLVVLSDYTSMWFIKTKRVIIGSQMPEKLVEVVRQVCSTVSIDRVHKV